MSILIIDTSIRSTLCVAIEGGTPHIADVAVPSPDYPSTSASIIPVVDEVLGSACITPDKLTCIAAVVGPGSFTGLRIGVSVANAMGTLGAAMLGVNVLDVLAFGAPEGTLCAVPSRVGYCYTQRGECSTEEVSADSTSVGTQGTGANCELSREQYIRRLIAYVEAHVGDATPHPVAPLYLKKSQAERMREEKHD